MSKKSETLARDIVSPIRNYDATPVEKHKALSIIGGVNLYELVAMKSVIQLPSR
jgi:hypothetical protein